MSEKPKEVFSLQLAHCKETEQPIAESPNHYVRSCQHVGRNREANLLGGFQMRV
jgi:hypothetical protein